MTDQPVTQVIQKTSSDLELKMIAILILVVIGLLFWMDHLSVKNNNEQQDLKNQIASKDSVVKDKDSSYSRLSLQYSSQSDLNNLLKSQNIDLAAQEKKDKEKIQDLISANIQSDTVYVDSSHIQYSRRGGLEHFVAYQKPYKIEGDYALDSAIEKKIQNLNILMDELKLIILESKTEDGFFKATVKLTDLNGNDLPNFKVYSITSAVNTSANKPVSDYFALGLGARLSVNALDVGGIIKVGEGNNFIVDYKIIDNNLNLSNLTWYNKISIGYYRLLW